MLYTVGFPLFLKSNLFMSLIKKWFHMEVRKDDRAK